MASRTLRIPGVILVRLYALVIMLLIVWSGYAAVAYLYRFVFRPVRVPAQFLDWQGHLDADALRMANVPGVTGVAARAPLAHYHSVDRWFQPEPHNNCTTSGCHSPLPHRESKATRAFANLHSTFLECAACHSPPAGAPEPAMWVNIETGLPQDVPPVLQLMRLIQVQEAQIQESPAAVSGKIQGLLEQSIRAVRGDSLLEYLLLEMRACQPGSPVWRRAMRQLRDALPSRARGEYGAKIAPRAGEEEVRRAAREAADQVRQYQSAAPGSPERDRLYKTIHGPVVTKPKGCVSCHGGVPTRLDFETLGYPPARVDHLRSTPNARLMQDIQEGRPFTLPRIGEGGNVH